MENKFHVDIDKNIIFVNGKGVQLTGSQAVVALSLQNEFPGFVRREQMYKNLYGPTTRGSDESTRRHVWLLGKCIKHTGLSIVPDLKGGRKFQWVN